ncbi:uncharacterized protein LOC126043146 isoform X2 [Accipiter gentilis]|uniref:uncharacterized protein LOC126043146 isoform X2 n=1 Tax=Astur gentilis TaxID=8957 RepID=UPI00211076C2|nr:uncharacterized protein LOC126043146 isoform X2 [Accipiter gentilis]
MEGPAAVMCLRTCYIKDCKPLHFAENPSELGQSHLSRNCSCSRRMMKQRRSNSISMCTLPIIPEYPGFQDIKDLERGKSSSSQLNNFPNRASLVHCLGSSSRGYLKGHPTTSSGFHDKPLQEYFNERLMELRNYESKRSNRKTKVFADKNQNAFLTHRGCRRRSSCSAVVMIGHGKESEESCSSANQDEKKVIERNDQEETQNVLDLCKGDILDILTMHIAAPLEAFVQKK